MQFRNGIIYVVEADTSYFGCTKTYTKNHRQFNGAFRSCVRINRHDVLTDESILNNFNCRH